MPALEGNRGVRVLLWENITVPTPVISINSSRTPNSSLTPFFARLLGLKPRRHRPAELGSEYIGFVEIDDGEWNVDCGLLPLGCFHEHNFLVEDVLGCH